MKKLKSPKKRIVRMTYDHVIVRVCLCSPIGAKARVLKEFSSVHLVAALFQTTPMKVAKDVARLNAGVEEIFNKSRSERKAKS